jgi:hypothetical protein
MPHLILAIPDYLHQNGIFMAAIVAEYADLSVDSARAEAFLNALL